MLLSSILGKAAIDSGYDVRTGEQHGLSQRSGSIYVHFRFGKDIEWISPLIPIGKADIMIAMEASEALRYIEYLKDDGVIIMSNRILPPVTETEFVALEKNREAKYLPLDRIVEKLREVTNRVVVLDSLKLATEAGHPRTENSVLIGATCACEGFLIPTEEVRSAVLSLVPPKTRDANLKAFELGLEASGTCLGTENY
jgi:indolepyruvate ferredoxin oxidoreductase beta subunit